MFDTFPEKILEIIGEHGPLLHHQIVDFQKENPILQRSSSKTFYVAYKHLLKAGWIQKTSISQEIVDKTSLIHKLRHYLGYKITVKGRLYLRTKAIQQSLGKQFDTLLDTMIKAQPGDDTTKIIKQQIPPIEAPQLHEDLPELIPESDDFQDDLMTEINTESILDEKHTAFIPKEHFYPGRTTSELIEMLGSNQDVVNYELILSEILRSRKISAEEKTLLLKTVIKIPNLLRTKYCLKEIQPNPRELIDLLFLIEKEDASRIDYIFEEIVNSKISESDKLDFFESYINSKKEIDLNYFIRLNYSQFSLIGLAHLHKTKPKKEIRDLIITLLLRKISQLVEPEKKETQVDLLEYAIKTEYFNQNDLYLSIQSKEIFRDMPLDVFLYLAHMKLNGLDQENTYNSNDLFILYGLTTKKLCLVNDYEWDRVRFIKGQNIIPKKIVDKYTTTYKELPENYIAILLDFYVFLIKNNKSSYQDYLITLKLLNNYRIWNQLYSLIDSYMPKKLRDQIKIPHGKHIHEVILSQMNQEYNDLKLIIIHSFNEKYRTDPESGMNLEIPEKWMIFSWIDLCEKVNTLKFEKLSNRLEEYSIIFHEQKTGFTNDIEFFEFYMNNMFNEEELIIFTPYFARWTNVNRNLGKEWALKLLQQFVKNSILIIKNKNTYLQVLDLLIKWEIDPELLKKWKTELTQQMEILEKIKKDFKIN